MPESRSTPRPRREPRWIGRLRGADADVIDLRSYQVVGQAPATDPESDPEPTPPGAPGQRAAPRKVA